MCGDVLCFILIQPLFTKKNTLACVIALKTWNVHSDKCNKGAVFNSLSNNK